MEFDTEVTVTDFYSLSLASLLSALHSAKLGLYVPLHNLFCYCDSFYEED
jgi:hypothetical protein